MAKAILLIVFISIFLNYKVSAQTNQKHYIGFHAGLGYYQMRDELVSPLIYSGSRMPINLLYKYDGQKNRHCIEIFYHGGKVSSSVKNWIEDIRFGFQYGFHRHIAKIFDGRFRLFMGGAWHNLLSDRYSHLKVHIGISSKVYSDINSYEFISSLNIAFTGEYQIRKIGRFVFQTLLPIMAYIARPGYSLGSPEGPGKVPWAMNIFDKFRAGELVFPDNYLQVKIMAALELKLSNRINLRPLYSLLFYRFAEPQMTGTVMNELAIQIMVLL